MEEPLIVYKLLGIFCVIVYTIAVIRHKPQPVKNGGMEPVQRTVDDMVLFDIVTEDD